MKRATEVLVTPAAALTTQAVKEPKMAERLLSRSAPARNDFPDPHIPGIRQEVRDAADAVRLCAAEVSVYDPDSAQELVVHYRAILKLADSFQP